MVTSSISTRMHTVSILISARRSWLVCTRWFLRPTSRLMTCSFITWMHTVTSILLSFRISWLVWIWCFLHPASRLVMLSFTTAMHTVSTILIPATRSWLVCVRWFLRPTRRLTTACISTRMHTASSILIPVRKSWLVLVWWGFLRRPERIVGRDLVPEKFQFKFKTEEDLQSVLKEAPFHFKRWMFVLQRWEPIISDAYPSLIPFWTRVHGIPPHCCTENNLKAIGNVLGQYVAHDIEEAMVKVEIDALKPLLKKKAIQFPSGVEVSVTFEYIRLEKHCFICMSLGHEKENCPQTSKTRELELTAPPRVKSPPLLPSRSDSVHHRDNPAYPRSEAPARQLPRPRSRSRSPPRRILDRKHDSPAPRNYPR
ncbi:hypothetical protein EUTSA_v10027498mg, partial [Eutrema salsugineum]